MSQTTKLLEELLPSDSRVIIEQAKTLDGEALAKKALDLLLGIEEVYSNKPVAYGCGRCMDFDPYSE